LLVGCALATIGIGVMALPAELTADSDGLRTLKTGVEGVIGLIAQACFVAAALGWRTDPEPDED